jgi:hypothetical protein
VLIVIWEGCNTRLSRRQRRTETVRLATFNSADVVGEIVTAPIVNPISLNSWKKSIGTISAP